MRKTFRNHNLDTNKKINIIKECKGQKLCSDCDWSINNGGPCSGCDNKYEKRCIKRICYYNCYMCSGGRHAHVIGCCGKAPTKWREYWARLLKYNITEYTPEPIDIGCRLIPIIYAQIKKYRIPELFPQIDAWTVPIHKVMNREGKFKSKDLKDYLGLPPDRKLILSTCAPDDYQELLWRKMFQMEYEKHGIDYWFPAHFSIYDNDSKMYQFANAKRQQMHAIWTKSQFVWFRLGENIPLKFMRSIYKAPSILISKNQMYSKSNKEILNKEVKVADSWFPDNTKFFVIGSIGNLPINSDRICYEINSNWIMRGLKGYDIYGKLDLKIPKDQVLINNLKETIENVK